MLLSSVTGFCDTEGGTPACKGVVMRFDPWAGSEACEYEIFFYPNLYDNEVQMLQPNPVAFHLLMFS